MSIEQKIDLLIEALNANTLALSGASASTTKTATTETAAKDSKPAATEKPAATKKAASEKPAATKKAAPKEVTKEDVIATSTAFLDTDDLDLRAERKEWFGKLVKGYGVAKSSLIESQEDRISFIAKVEEAMAADELPSLDDDEDDLV